MVTVATREKNVWQEFYTGYRSYIHPLLSVIGGLLLWEIAAQTVLTNRLIIVPLSSVAQTMWNLAKAGELWKHFYTSGMEFLSGFFLAAAAGIFLGFFMGTSTRIREFLEPLVSALYATPLVALIPFYIILFGISIASKISLAFTVAVFPVLINTYVGILSVDQNLLEVASSFGASRWQTFFKVQVPAALPFIVSGLRLGVGRALTGVVIGEFFFASAGLGFMISIAAQNFDTARVFVGVLIFVLAGVSVTAFLERIERRMVPWHRR